MGDRFIILPTGYAEPIHPIRQTRRHYTVYALCAQNDVEIPSHSAVQVNLSAIYANDPYDEYPIDRFLCLTPDSLLAEHGCHCITRIVYSDEVITVWIGNMTSNNVLITRGNPVCELMEY